MKVLELAKNEVGYLEKKSSGSLYEKILNAGDKNYTKYWQDICPQFQGQPWCLCFLVWLFEKSYGSAEAKKMLYMPSYTFYTPTAANYFKKNNAWYSSPSVGDIIFFQDNTRICHVGIVYDVKNGQVFTYEGNTSSGAQVVANGGGVFAKSYALTNKRIAGYGRPKYAETQSQAAQATPPQSFISVGIDVSRYQGIIDWNTVHQAGVNFTIIKAVDKNGNPEINFEKNYAGAIAAGVKIEGVYNYSYATTVEKACQDANAIVKVLGDRKVRIWLDVEDDCQKNIGTKLVDIILAYKNIVEKAGFGFGIYTGMSFYNSFIAPYKASIGQVPLWIARYGKNDGTFNETYKPTIDGMCIWQYTSQCMLPGISGYVDMNVKYIEPTNAPAAVTKPSNSYKVKVTANALNVRSGPGTDYKINTVVKKNEIYSIVEEQGTWGKLISGAGWISLNYVQKI